MNHPFKRAFGDKSQHQCWCAVNKNMWSLQQNLYIPPCLFLLHPPSPEHYRDFCVVVVNWAGTLVLHCSCVKGNLRRNSRPNSADILQSSCRKLLKREKKPKTQQGGSLPWQHGRVWSAEPAGSWRRSPAGADRNQRSCCTLWAAGWREGSSSSEHAAAWPAEPPRPWYAPPRSGSTPSPHHTPTPDTQSTIVFNIDGIKRSIY